MYLRGLGSTTIPNTSRGDCDAAGGIFSGSILTSQYAMGTCTIPDKVAASAPPANVTVNTTTSTQVSPSISPNLIQQQQPTNSPVGATTSSAPAQTASAPTQDTSMQTYLAQMAAEQAARDKALTDALTAAQQAQPVQQAQPQTIMIPNAPAQTDAVPVDNTVAPVQTATMPDTSKYILYGVAALLGVTLIMSRNAKKH